MDADKRQGLIDILDRHIGLDEAQYPIVIPQKVKVWVEIKTALDKFLPFDVKRAMSNEVYVLVEIYGNLVYNVLISMRIA
jgi:hypothetical protein